MLARTFHRMRPLVQEVRSAWLPVLLGQAYGFTCGLVAVRWTTRLVVPEVYGTYGLFLTAINLAPSVVFAGLLRHVAQTWPTATDRPGIARMALGRVRAGWPWLASAALLAGAIGAGIDRDLVWLILAPLLVAVNATMLLGMLAHTALQAERAYWPELGVTVVSAAARAFIPLGFAALFSGTATVLASGYLVHTLGWLAALAVIWLPRLRAARTAKESAAPPGSEWRTYALNGLLGWALLGLNRWCAGAAFSPADAGCFMLAANLAFIVPSMLSSATGAVFSPIAFSRAAAARHAGDWRALARTTDRRALLFFAAAAGATVLLWLVGPQLLGVLIAERYAPALPWLLATGAFWTAIGLRNHYQLLLQAAGAHVAALRVTTGALALAAFGGGIASAAGPDAFRGWLLATPLLVLAAERAVVQRVVAKRGRRL